MVHHHSSLLLCRKGLLSPPLTHDSSLSHLLPKNLTPPLQAHRRCTHTHTHHKRPGAPINHRSPSHLRISHSPPLQTAGGSKTRTCGSLFGPFTSPPPPPHSPPAGPAAPPVVGCARPCPTARPPHPHHGRPTHRCACMHARGTAQHSTGEGGAGAVVW